MCILSGFLFSSFFCAKKWLFSLVLFVNFHKYALLCSICLTSLTEYFFFSFYITYLCIHVYMYIKGVCVCARILSEFLFYSSQHYRYCHIYCTGFICRTPLTVHKIEPFIFILLHIFFRLYMYIHVHTLMICILMLNIRYFEIYM